jgi:O-antigen ligase
VFRLIKQPRYAILVGLVFTYVWRFHDLTSVIASLRIVAICTVGSWLYLLASPRIGVIKRALTRPYVICFLLFSLWALASVPGAIYPDWAWGQWSDGQVKTVTMFLFIVSCITSVATLKLVVAIQVIGGGVLALFYIKSGFPQFYSPVPMYDRNDFALALNLALPFAIYLSATVKGLLPRIGAWGATLAIGTSVMMSQSRGAFLTLGVMALLVLITARTIKLRYRVIPPLLFIVAVPFLPTEVQDRLSTLLNPSEDYNVTSDTGRVVIWGRALGYLEDHKVFGVGFESFPWAEAVFGLGRPVAIHNSFLQAAVETGYPGFVLFTSMLLFAMARLLKIRYRLARQQRREGAKDLRLIADCLFLVVLSFCIGGFFLSMAYSPLIVAPIAYVAGFELVVEKWRREHRSVSRRPRPGRVHGREPNLVGSHTA